MFTYHKVAQDEALAIREAEEKYNIMCVKLPTGVWRIDHITSMNDVDDEPISFLLEKGFYFNQYIPYDEKSEVTNKYPLFVELEYRNNEN